MRSTEVAKETVIDKPNTEQQKAIDIFKGPALVVAGAGTGKTRVIVERITKLIERGIPPESVLALTFTEKAANEMLDRINAAKTGFTLDTTVSTFNRFGNDLLQRFGIEYGLGRLKLLGDTGQLVFLREHFDELELDYFSPVSNPDGQLEALAGYVSLLKQQLVTPDTYAQYATKLPEGNEAERIEKQKHEELARFFKIYLELCRQGQFIDYDDQIYLTIEMLEGRPNVLKSLQDQYQYILVDEFQDTNPMQSKLIDLLAGKTKNIMVVGDDDQSIYGWRGATLSNILDFKLRYPKAQEETLIENYRSTQTILDSAYRLIQHNNPHRLEVMNNLNKRLHGQTDGPEPSLKHFTSLSAELAWLAEDIQKRLGSGQEAGSIAVLTRRNHSVQQIHDVFELMEVPHVVAGLNNDIYAAASVRNLIEALKAVADQGDDLALFHTLSGPLFNIDISHLAAISGKSKRGQQSFSQALEDDGSEEIMNALRQIRSWCESSRDTSVGYLAYKMLNESGWRKRLYEQAHDLSVVREVQALEKFFKTLKEFERIAGVASVQQYIINLPVLEAAGNTAEDATLDIANDQINVLSVHRAKGLEWQTVYIVDCTEGSFPLSTFGSNLKLPPELQANPSQADEHMAEERRLMYVAVTRAKAELVLSYADRHGSGAQRKPSRFLAELLGHEPTATIYDEAAQVSLELFAPRDELSGSVALPESMLKDGRLHLSVSQIESWLRCPQDFYYKYVLNMPLPPAPQLEYGSLIHSVIEKIHLGRQQGNAPNLEELTREVIDNLPQVGYESKRSRERAHAQAPKTVKAVYDRFMNDELPIETEWPFSLEMPNMPLTIRGKIDAVYQLEEGVEIRDFKTGTSVRTADQAKSRTTGSHQLTLYALAWQQLRGAMPARLSLDFVETGQSYGVKKQPKSLETLEDKLDEMCQQLLAGKYPASRDHKHCMHPL